MTEFGPRKPSFSTLALRLLGALTGSIVGTLAMFGIFVLSSGLSTEGSVRVISVFVLLILIIVGSLVTNLVTALCIRYFDDEFYPRGGTLFSHIFMFHIVLFVVAIPLYFTLQSLPFGEETVRYLTAFHFFTTVTITGYLMELLSENKHKIVAAYAMSISSLYAFCVLLFLYATGLENFVFFLIAPTLWIGQEIFRTLTEVIYYYFYQFYGIDALNNETNLDEDE